MTSVAAESRDDPAAGSRPAIPGAAAWASALALAAAADWLFWGHGVGLSLAAFAVLVAGAVVAVGPAAGPTRIGRASLVLALGCLPVVELVQPLSLAFLAVALVVFMLDVSGRPLLRSAGEARFLLGFPVAGLAWLSRDLRAAAGAAPDGWRRAVAAWGLPAGLGAVFLLLFAAANPLIEASVEAALDLFGAPLRMGFWTAAVLAVWPFLRLGARALPRVAQAAAPSPRPTRWHGLISESSATGALAIFNLIFAVETALDLVYLWGGAALPDRMTHAAYAHRGAYPLMATALLAGGFVVFATTALRPTRAMLWLIHLWIAQNILLLVSSALRLQLYVAAYALTYWRVAAFIWMGLVAFGFVLLVLRLAWRKDNRWLITRNAAAAAAVLYGCCYMDFAQMIAR